MGDIRSGGQIAAAEARADFAAVPSKADSEVDDRDGSAKPSYGIGSLDAKSQVCDALSELQSPPAAPEQDEPCDSSEFVDQLLAGAASAFAMVSTEAPKEEAAALEARVPRKKRTATVSSWKYRRERLMRKVLIP